LACVISDSKATFERTGSTLKGSTPSFWFLSTFLVCRKYQQNNKDEDGHLTSFEIMRFINLRSPNSTIERSGKCHSSTAKRGEDGPCTKTRTHSVAPSSLQELSTAQHPLQSTVPAHSKSVPVQKTFQSHLSTLRVTNNGGPRTLNKL
jgi:hypothetical protein